MRSTESDVFVTVFEMQDGLSTRANNDQARSSVDLAETPLLLLVRFGVGKPFAYGRFL
jgi:hypothetical protein